MKNTATSASAKLSEEIELTMEDRVPDLLFSRIIWKAVKGEDSGLPEPRRSAYVKIKVGVEEVAEERAKPPAKKKLGRRGKYCFILFRRFRNFKHTGKHRLFPLPPNNCYMKVSDILQSKGTHVFSVAPGQNVYEALKLMAEKNIGALVVLENGALAGILSERDYARKVVLKGKTSPDTLVREIMTEKVITVHPGETIERCMQLMSDNHIRHLPVAEGGSLRGVISISDVVTAIIETQKETIASLQNYLAQ